MSRKEWNVYLKEYAKANHKKVGIQIANTVVPYVALLLSILYMGSKGVSFFILFPLSVVAAGLMVRIFIFFHDCTHQSYVATGKGNDILGNIFGMMVFTPYEAWKKEHSIHHGAVGNLDQRGVGDIWTLTIDEYEASSKLRRFTYRLFRHPAFLFTIAPVFLFIVLQRFPKKTANKKERKNYLIVNSILLIYSVVLSLAFGWQVYVAYQVLIIAMASTAGVWLFYVQHQFEDVYWESSEEWDLVEAALRGSTFYKLPIVFEWVSGYIGYHHIHHLNARIPNYNLKACYKSSTRLQDTKTVLFFESFKLGMLQFYDNHNKKLITYKQLKNMRRRNAVS
jgi:omega-6 fatty acid desaturase (delta-12 desaturase)